MIEKSDIDQMRDLIPFMSDQDQAEAVTLMESIAEIQRVDRAQSSFLGFVREVWPGFIESGHHRVMAEAFDRVERGECKRLVINMAPRHTKSEFASHMFPSYCLGKDPTRKIMQTSNTTELAVGFGRKVRNMITEPEFHKIFPDTGLSADSKAAQRWSTVQGGEYYATGVGGALAGRGADILIIDDPHSEQEAKLNSLAIYDGAYEWYMTGPRQRLQPGGAIIIVMTRWHKVDLTGRVLQDMVGREGADQWEVIELPAMVNEHEKDEAPIWPSFWDYDELKATRASLPVSRWNAQFQQNPTSKEGALVKHEWWQDWGDKEPPDVEYIIQCWDTAYTAKQKADFSACSTWGIFRNDKGERNIILLDCFKERMEFPDLKVRAEKEYQRYKPDNVLIEAKAAGWPLIYELRIMGIPVTDITYSRGEDKTVRVNSVTDIFKSGMIWAPDTKFADEMITEFMEFPYGDHDDLLDTATMALRRFREGGFIRLDSDEEWDTGPKRPLIANFY